MERTQQKKPYLSRGLLWALIIVALAGIVFYQASLRPFMQYWDLVHDVQNELDSFHHQRPANVDASQWEDAVGWTSNILGNVSMMTCECDIDFLRRFQSSLNEKMDRGVNLETLKWMWDELAKAGPRAADYAYKYRPIHLMVAEPITDETLRDLWGIDSCRVIDLRGADITDAGLIHLKSRSRAEFIYLDDTNVTPAGVAELQKALPDCEIVRGDL